VPRWGGLVLVAFGAIPPLLVTGYYMAHFDLSPLHGVWYVFLLLVGGQWGLVGTAAGLAFTALFLSTVSLVLVRPPDAAYGDGRRSSRPSEPRLPILGPGGHAGPGALGNTRTFR